MVQKIPSLVIQEFLNHIKERKSDYIRRGIVVFPDVFAGDFKNTLFEHKQYKNLISNKIKEVFATEWVAVDIGIIKKDRLEEFFKKNDIPHFQGYKKSLFIPIARIHKNSSTETNSDVKASMGTGDNIFDKECFETTMNTLLDKIVQTINSAIEEKGRVNSKINLPGISAEIVYDSKKYREFVKSLAPFVEKLETALGFVLRKDIIGHIDYYIKRDVGGILKIDAFKNGSHEIFNQLYRERLKSLQKESSDFEPEHQKIKSDIKKKRDLFQQSQRDFMKQLELKVMQDDFFSGRSKSEKRYEKIYIDDFIYTIIKEFPELENDFFDAFVRKMEMILSSNNITKKDVIMEYSYIDKNPDEKPHISVEFKNIENFRITRGLRKYNGIFQSMPLNEEEQKLFDQMVKQKEQLLNESEAMFNKGELTGLYQINKELTKIKKEFPALKIDLKLVQEKINALEDLRKKESAEKNAYENALLNIDAIANDRTRLEDEIFNLSINSEDGPPKGLRSSEKHMQSNQLLFLEKLAITIAGFDMLSLAKISSYDNFDISKSTDVIFEILYNSFINSSLEDVPSSKKEQLKEALIKKESLRTKIFELAKTYSSNSSTIFVNAFADSFFNIIAEAKTNKKIPKIISEMIEGTKKYKPIFETETAHITHRADQVQMRVKEAMRLKNSTLDNWSAKIHAVEVKLIKAESDNKACLEAKNMTTAKIKKFTASKIADIVFNKDGKFSNEKRMFLWLDIENIKTVREMLLKTKEAGALEHRRSSLDTAINFFDSLLRTNTKEQLDAKTASLNNQMRKYEQTLESVIAGYERESRKSLYEFDNDLKRMKNAFVKNFAKPRK